MTEGDPFYTTSQSIMYYSLYVNDVHNNIPRYNKLVKNVLFVQNFRQRHNR